MKGVKWCFGLLLVLFTIFGLSLSVFSKDADAIPVTSIEAFQFFKRTNPNAEYTISTLNGGGIPYRWLVTTTPLIQVRSTNFSASTGQTQSGNYFTGSATIKLSISSPPLDGFDYIGGYDCHRITEVDIRPQQGNIVSESYNIDSCNVTSGYYSGLKFLTLKVSGSGKLSDITSVSSYYISIKSIGDFPFLSYQGYSPTEAYIIFDGLDVNFNVSTDPSTAALGEINQNTININNQLQEMNDRDAQDRQDLQNTSDSASASAEEAGEEISESGEQLLYVLTNFFDIFVHPPASNCIIDGDAGHMDLGDIDLCQLDPPPAISVLGTLLMIGAVIPLCISGINTLIKIVGEVYTT